MKILFVKKSDGSKWDYYLERHFAWLPRLLNTGGVFPAIVWLWFWYETYPVDDNGSVVELYRSYYTTDPRKTGD